MNLEYRKDEKHKKLPDLLLRWYQITNRLLPWRKSYTAYHIWISEVMLQQTQMGRGVTYFNRWIKEFPDVAAVATASEEHILRLWQGLGYYSRARNIHRAAKILIEKFDGILPDDYETLQTLPGIGEYTAAAIASIAGNHNIAVVDANVIRVYARIFDIAEPVKSGIGLRKIKELAKKLLPEGDQAEKGKNSCARHYNQAIMDFGGLLCTPKSPQCGICPVKELCLAFINGTVSVRPVLPRKKKKVFEKKIVGLIVSPPKNSSQTVKYDRGERDIDICSSNIFIYQREKEKLWAGLWDLPGKCMVTSEATQKGRCNTIENRENVQDIISAVVGFSVISIRHLITVSHQYTHHQREVECWICIPSDGKKEVRAKIAGKWVSFSMISNYAFPAGARKIFDFLKNLD